MTATLELVQKQPAARAAERWLRPLKKLARVAVDFLAPDADHPTGDDATNWCRLMNEAAPGCALCCNAHGELRRRAVASRELLRTVCPNGLAVFALPVVSGSSVTGIIEGGRVFTTPPDDAVFEKVRQRVRGGGLCVDPVRLRMTYFQVPTLSEEELSAAIDVLRCVAESVAGQAEAPLPETPAGETPQIAKARKYIEEHLGEKLSVAKVARVVSLSGDYFSKLFKRSTGLAFTEYVARTRVRHAQQLLVGSQKRISEIAYDAGFESVPHFNRLFKRFNGVAPNAFRLSKWTTRGFVQVSLLFWFSNLLVDLGVDDLVAFFCSAEFFR